MASKSEENSVSEGGAPRREVVDEASAGIRVDHFLSERLAISRGQARRLLAQGRVSQDGGSLGLGAKGRGLPAGAAIEVSDLVGALDPQIFPEPDSGAVLRILGEGEGWLAVDKAAGAPVHPLLDGERGTVLNQIVARYPELQAIGEGGLRSGVVHRLDVDTSGVLLVAKQQGTWDRLRAAFREHRVEKIYRAIVLGDYQGPTRVELGIQVARHRPARVRVVPGISDSTTKSVWIARQTIRKLETLRGASLLELRLETGFLHQVRATLAHLGHPLAGDSAYLDGRKDPSGAVRHQLHATRIRYEEISAESPDAEDFSETLNRLR